MFANLKGSPCGLSSVDVGVRYKDLFYVINGSVTDVNPSVETSVESLEKVCFMYKDSCS